MPSSRRTLLLRTLATAGASGFLQRALADSPMPPSSTSPGAATIQVSIDGRTIGRPEVLAWELRRAIVVWKKLRRHAAAPVRSQLDDMLPVGRLPLDGMDRWRQELLALKLQIGNDRMKQLLKVELGLSEAVMQLLLMFSGGRYAPSVIDIRCDQGSAAGFVSWFEARFKADDQPAFLVACPDHYVIETEASGNQYVLETTGGSPMPTQFDIDYRDLAGNPLREAADLPMHIGGRALDTKGKTIGYAYHQFGDQGGGGFMGRLAIAFPRGTPQFMLSGHQWHLACEFSNWIEAYLRS